MEYHSILNKNELLWTDDVKLSVFADDMVLHVEKSKDQQQTRTNKQWRKITRYNINIKISYPHLS